MPTIPDPNIYINYVYCIKSTRDTPKQCMRLKISKYNKADGGTTSHIPAVSTYRRSLAGFL